MKYKKLAIFAGIAFVLYFIIDSPTEAAGMARDAAGHVGHAAGKLAEFVKALIS